MPTLIVIGGPNGAGKTTFAREFLPNEANCLRFLNSDEIARGLSPFDPSLQSVRAGRLLLEEFGRLVEAGESFAFESTLSGKSYVRRLEKAKQRGYRIELHFMYITSVEASIQRVRQRVKKGGHNVPVEHLRRRFGRIQKNLIENYLPLMDQWAVWDNERLPPVMLASSATHDSFSLEGLF